MTRTPDRADLAALVDELIGTDQLLVRVRQLLPQQGATGPSDPDLAGGGHVNAKTRAAPIPWNAEAAEYVLTIHAEVRHLERDLQLLVHHRSRLRGGSERNTLAALTGLPDLIMVAVERHGGHCDPAANAVTALHRWPRQARAILDEARTHEVPWTNAPGGLCCPHCGRRLQLRPGWERDVERADLVCRGCPVQVDGDEAAEERRPDRSWPADEWIGVLQQDVSA